MRITVEIDEKSLQAIQEATGERKKSPAVQKVIENFLYEQRKRAFLEKVRRGETDYSTTNDELEGLLVADSDRHLPLD